MIKLIDLSRLRNAEYIQFMRDTRSIVQANDPVALQVQAQYVALGARLAEIEALFVTDQGNPITPIIAALDLRRDNAITGIAKVVDGHTSHYEAPKAAAAQLLVDNLGLYGTSIFRQNYLAETTTINNIVVDWTTQAPLQDAVAELQLADWLDELRSANIEFNQQYIARTQAIGAMNPDTIRQKRGETSDMYYFMRSFIDFYYSSNPGLNPWDATTNQLNALIDQYNVILALRASEPEGENPPPPPPPPQG